MLMEYCLFNIFNRNRNSTIATFNADAATKEEITDELVIALFQGIRLMQGISSEVLSFCLFLGGVYEITIRCLGEAPALCAFCSLT